MSGVGWAEETPLNTSLRCLTLLGDDSRLYVYGRAREDGICSSYSNDLLREAFFFFLLGG